MVHGSRRRTRLLLLTMYPSAKWPPEGLMNKLGRTLDDCENVACYTRAFGDEPRNLNHGQVTWSTPELAPPLLTTTNGRTVQLSTDLTCIAALRRVFSGTQLELVTRQATNRYLYHSYRGPI
ncbi:hypothetical protein TNCV_2584571 [Trichonephila clavipes]|nr:hypothetical protein TNCV_2584571 [Trichonephila clavipes]